MTPEFVDRSDRKIGGFTLVELLVVFAVVAILAAILIPVINQVRKNARTSQCVQNKRQITTAYQLWIIDNGNKLWDFTPYQGFNEWGSPIIGDQARPTQPGYFTTMLVPYGFEQAQWHAWQAIDNRANTVWYCPCTYDDTRAQGWGSTYFYCSLGREARLGKDAVSMDALGDVLRKKPYLWDYLGNHHTDSANWPATGENVFAYLDGHVDVK